MMPSSWVTSSRANRPDSWQGSQEWNRMEPNSRLPGRTRPCVREPRAAEGLSSARNACGGIVGDLSAMPGQWVWVCIAEPGWTGVEPGLKPASLPISGTNRQKSASQMLQCTSNRLDASCRDGPNLEHSERSDAQELKSGRRIAITKSFSRRERCHRFAWTRAEANRRHVWS
jgi:hypothetical protein